MDIFKPVLTILPLNRKEMDLVSGFDIGKFLTNFAIFSNTSGISNQVF
jgi:hypothetical protein